MTGPARIPLENGGYVIVDREDYVRLAQSRWRRVDRGAVSYAVRVGTTEYLHRDVVSARGAVIVDHVNRDGLDNRRVNLRLTNKQGNSANRGLQKNNTSGFRGVRKQSRANTWTAEIQVDGCRRYLGSFRTAAEAAHAYDAAAAEAFGEFAFQNFPHCQRPDACGASGLKHCHACQTIADAATEAA